MKKPKGEILERMEGQSIIEQLLGAALDPERQAAFDKLLTVTAAGRESDDDKLGRYQMDVILMLRNTALDTEQEWEVRFQAAHLLLHGV